MRIQGFISQKAGSGKEHEVFERVYALKLEEKTNANYKGSQMEVKQHLELDV
jgi:hypothetical protein